MKCYVTGTIQTNKKFIPNEIKNPKIAKNEIVAYRRKDILLLAWRDKRIVTMLSTCATSSSKTVTKRTRKEGRTNIVKPDVVINYNKYIGGVDKANQYTGTYCFMRKSQKWWRKLFFWGLEVSVINSYLLYQEHQKKHDIKKLTHLQFVRRLVAQLIGDFRDTNPKIPSTSETAERLNGLLHIIRRDERGRSKDCVVCSNRKVKHGKRESRYYCATCAAKPTLHIGTVSNDTTQCTNIKRVIYKHNQICLFIILLDFMKKLFRIR